MFVGLTGRCIQTENTQARRQYSWCRIPSRSLLPLSAVVNFTLQLQLQALRRTACLQVAPELDEAEKEELKLERMGWTPDWINQVESCHLLAQPHD